MKKYLGILLLFSLAACGTKKIKTAGTTDVKDTITGPYSYNLNLPEKFYMPDELHEISGIAFSKGNSDTIYAEQDEAGKLFHFKLGDKEIISSKFGKKGDYEDVAICNDKVIMLRSDGILFSFQLWDARSEKIEAVQEWTGLLPEGEFEGLWADEQANLLYVLCKHCGGEKTSKTCSGVILQITTEGKIIVHGNFSIDVREIEALTHESKISFHPSALAKSPVTAEWYIVSSVNKLLVVADENWKPKAAYPLDPAIFNQPEGIAFDKGANLYISNEGGDDGRGTILKFKYSKK